MYSPIRFALAPMAAAVLAAFSAQAGAADPVSRPAITHLQEIVVIDTNDSRSALGVSTGAIQAQRSLTSDSASLLKDVPGVSLNGAGAVSSLPAIHGLADDRLRIKIDGMDLISSCPNHMNPPLSYVDPTNVGAIKVYAGISPVSVGGDSIGGSIVVETSAPDFAQPGEGALIGGEAGTFYRSNGSQTGGNLAASLATESVSIRYAGAVAKSENYSAGGDFKNYTFTGRAGHTLDTDEVGSTAYKTQNHTLGIAFKSGDHMVEAKLGYQDMPYQNYPNQRMDMLGNEQERINLRYFGKQDWGTVEARGYHEKVDHYMDFGADKRYWYGSASGGNTALNGAPCSPISATCATGMPMYTEGKTTGAVVNASIDLAQQALLRVGAEFQQYRLNDWWPVSGAGMWPNTFLNINDGERDRAAMFGEWEKRYGPHWLGMIGVRYERVTSSAGQVHGYDQASFPTVPAPAGAMNQNQDAANFNNSDRSTTDDNWDATVLARYTVDERQDVEFGYARKTRSPNLYERYTWSTAQMMMIMNNTVGDGNGYVGDVNLKPEVANTVSATFDWHASDRKWEFKATPYYTHVSDYIDAVRCAAGAMGGCSGNVVPNPTKTSFVRLKYANQTARIFGLDLSGQMPLAQTGIGAFGLGGLINYVNGKNTDTDDELYNIMPLNGKLTLSHKLGGWSNGVELVGVAAKNDVSEVRNETRTPGYGLTNLRASHSWQAVRVDLGIENVFDKHYYLPTSGAYTGQGTTMANPALPNYPQWGTAVPGMGRSFYAGLNLKF